METRGTLSSGTLELLSKSNKATGFGAGGAELTISTLEGTRTPHTKAAPLGSPPQRLEWRSGGEARSKR